MLKELRYRLARMTLWEIVLSGVWRVTLIAAALWRRTLPRVTFVGITGSVGKTTTKDLIAASLASRFSVVSNRDSINRNLGVSMTLLRTRHHHRFCVQEIAARGPNTMNGLIRTFRPDVAVLTHIQRDHYRAFRGREAVAAEKSKLVAALPAGGLAVLNADDPLVLAMATHTRARVLTYGLNSGATVRAEAVAGDWPERLHGTLLVNERRLPFSTQLCGRHWIHGVLAAVTVAQAFGVPPEAALAAIATVPPVPGRMSPREVAPGITFIEDYWKGSLDSWVPALDFMRRATARRKIVVIGHVADYPGAATPKYVRLAREALEFAEGVYLLGVYGCSAAEKLRDRRVQARTTVQALSTMLHSELRAGDLVLLKGAGRVDHLERVVLSYLPDGVGCWREHCGQGFLCWNCRKSRSPRRVTPHDACS